jgi:hypothetical protein
MSNEAASHETSLSNVAVGGASGLLRNSRKKCQGCQEEDQTQTRKTNNV